MAILIVLPVLCLFSHYLVNACIPTQNLETITTTTTKSPRETITTTTTESPYICPVCKTIYDSSKCPAQTAGTSVYCLDPYDAGVTYHLGDYDNDNNPNSCWVKANCPSGTYPIYHFINNEDLWVYNNPTLDLSCSELKGTWSWKYYIYGNVVASVACQGVN